MFSATEAVPTEMRCVPRYSFSLPDPGAPGALTGPIEVLGFQHQGKIWPLTCAATCTT